MPGLRQAFFMSPGFSGPGQDFSRRRSGNFYRGRSTGMFRGRGAVSTCPGGISRGGARAFSWERSAVCSGDGAQCGHFRGRGTVRIFSGELFRETRSGGWCRTAGMTFRPGRMAPAEAFQGIITGQGRPRRFCSATRMPGSAVLQSFLCRMLLRTGV